MSTNLKSKKVIDNLDELIRRISKLEKEINKNEDYYLFRGQANSEWELNSTWRRQWEASKYCKNCDYCKKHKTNNEINDNKKLKTIAIINGFNKMKELMDEWGYKEKTDLEMLCEIQHTNNSNTPTFLIDFTSNIYNALWFAVCDGPINERNTNAKIFILKYDESLLCTKVEFKNLISKGMSNIYTLAPLNTILRSNAQKSYFIFDQENLEGNFDMESWEISYKIKEEILNYLKKKGVTAKSIYPDLLGAYKDTFTSIKRKMNNNNLFYDYIDPQQKMKDTFEIVKKSLDNISDNDLLDNIQDLTIKINQKNENYKELYYWRGIYYYHHMDFYKSISDCNKYIEVGNDKKNIVGSYFIKGAAYYALNKIYKSIQQYTNMIKIINDTKSYWLLPFAYFRRGINYTKQYELDKAIKDYTKAIEIDDRYKDAYVYRAIAYKKINKLYKALKDFEKH